MVNESQQIIIWFSNEITNWLTSIQISNWLNGIQIGSWISDQLISINLAIKLVTDLSVIESLMH